MDVRVTRWQEDHRPNESALLDLFQQEGLVPHAWSNEPGDSYAAHAHSYDKVIYVARGSITWILPEQGEEIETRAGDRIDLPHGVMHAAEVGPHGVTCLEAHR